MKTSELYDILLKEIGTLQGPFNVTNLTKKILGLNKLSQNDISDVNKRNAIVNVNKTIYLLMIHHAVINNIQIDSTRPVLNGRSFGENRGVTYTIDSDTELDETILKIIYLYINNIVELD